MSSSSRSMHRPENQAKDCSNHNGTYDVIVIGAGVEGSATAYYLTSRYTKNVLLLEQFSVLHCNGSSHGGSRITRKGYHKPFYAKMMETAFEMWPEIERKSGKQIYHQTGLLVFGDKRVNNYIDVLRKNDCPHQILSAEDVNKRYSKQLNLPKDFRCVIDKSGGILQANVAMDTLQTLFVQNGGHLLDNSPVSSILPTDELVTIVTTNGRTYWAPKVILTTGPWTNQLISPLGLELPLKPLRVEVQYWTVKESVHYQKDAFPCFMAFSPIARCYGIPIHEHPGLLKIGLHDGTTISRPDEQIPLGVTTPAVSDLIKAHFKGVEATSPAILEPCLYTQTPDQDPLIDFLPNHHNIIIGAGFSGHGFKLAPVVGQILSELALDVPLSHDVSPFRINRFNHMKSYL